jgi:hypothetical protein
MALLGDNGAVYFLAQQADHTLAEPVKISYSGTPKAMQIVDVDGDGKNDLVLVDFDSPTPFRVRLQKCRRPARAGNLFQGQPIRSFGWTIWRRRDELFRLHRAGDRARGGLAVHAQAGGAAVRRVSSRASFKSCR